MQVLDCKFQFAASYVQEGIMQSAVTSCAAHPQLLSTSAPQTLHRHSPLGSMQTTAAVQAVHLYSALEQSMPWSKSLCSPFSPTQPPSCNPSICTQTAAPAQSLHPYSLSTTSTTQQLHHAHATQFICVSHSLPLQLNASRYRPTGTLTHWHPGPTQPLMHWHPNLQHEAV